MYLASGKSENSNISWFNIDGYFKYTDTAEMCVVKRDENANILARAFLLDQDNKTRFPGEVYSNKKLLATKEYVDTKGTNDLNAHNSSSNAHSDIRTKITSDINAHNSSGTSHADIRRMFNSYLPLTGGTVSGRTHIDAMLSVGQSSAEASNIRVDGAAGNAYIALLNYNNAGNLLIDGYFNNPETAAIDVTNRDKNGTVRYRSTLIDGKGNAKFANEVYANEKLLATKEYVDTLLKSIQFISPGKTKKSYNENGYRVFSDGFCIQWGKGNDIPTNPGKLIQFPMAFNTIFGVFAMPIYKSSNLYKNALALNYVNTTNFKIMADDVTNSCFWVAVGII
ncbi:MAG: hypothetical protein HUJ83_10560 [Veillonella sp.]|nr:hypothetical protein [Veillonella sp.]